MPRLYTRREDNVKIAITKIFWVNPTPKPRMTKRDVWKKPIRPVVRRYREFKDQILFLRQGFNMPQQGAHIIFYMPMPKLSLKKRTEMNDKPHTKRPDLDNLVKALFDALFVEDSIIYDFRASKYWSFKPRIEIIYNRTV